MKELFAPDSTLIIILTKIFDIILLSLLWFVCCLPIVTIGTSTTALYSVTLKMTKNAEGGITRSFFLAFKQNFTKTLPMTCSMIITLTIIGCDVFFLGANENIKDICLASGIILLFFWFVVYGYVYPITAKYENTIKNTFVNAFKLAIIHPFRTVGIAAMNAAPLILAFVSLDIFLRAVPLLIIAGGGFIAYVNSYTLNSIFDKLAANNNE